MSEEATNLLSQPPWRGVTEQRRLPHRGRRPWGQTSWPCGLLCWCVEWQWTVLSWKSFEQRGHPLEGLIARCLIGGVVVGGIFSSAHEAVSGSFIGDGVVLLSGGLHGCCRGGNGGVDAGVVATVEAIDGSGDSGELRRRRAVKDEGCGKVFAMRGEGEGFAASPAEAGGDKDSVRGGSFLP